MIEQTTSTSLMTIRDVAEYLSIPVATIRTWRVKGEGPRALRVGKHLRYRQQEVDTWLERHAEPVESDAL